MDKLDDLENRTRRNNLHNNQRNQRKTRNAIDQIQLCTNEIPKALGFPRPCKVEREHRIGAPQTDRRRPRQFIIKYLNYKDEAAILQKFRSSRKVHLKGTDWLIFADYSAELTRKRKMLSKVCTVLYQKNIKFTSAYPATLQTLQMQTYRCREGAQCSFQDPDEVEGYITCLTANAENSPMTQKQRRTPQYQPNINYQLLTTPKTP